MSDRLPPVTVVIPAWDSPYVELLPRAVETVRVQDHDIAVLIVDNVSRVPVPRLEGTRVVTTPKRLSAGEARNHALPYVTTEYVMFLDADDELIGGALGIVRRGIAQDPGLAVYAMSLVEAETGRRHRFPRRLSFFLSRFPRAFALGTSIWSLYATQGCAIFRTAWVRQCGGYADLSGPEDWVLGVSQAFRGRVRLDRRPGLVRTLHPTSLAHDQHARRLMIAGRQVRDRLRSDPAVPRWARALIPLVWLSQAFLIFGVRPIYRALARARR